MDLEIFDHIKLIPVVNVLCMDYEYRNFIAALKKNDIEHSFIKDEIQATGERYIQIKVEKPMTYDDFCSMTIKDDLPTKFIDKNGVMQFRKHYTNDVWKKLLHNVGYFMKSV